MSNGCGLAVKAGIGILAAWLAAFLFGRQFGLLPMVVALIPAAIVTAMLVPVLVRGVRQCRNRRR
ncbi:MAG: hypothetical protein ACJ8ER_11985 [Allosphingosinicella sp.]